MPQIVSPVLSYTIVTSLYYIICNEIICVPKALLFTVASNYSVRAVVIRWLMAGLTLLKLYHCSESVGRLPSLRLYPRSYIVSSIALYTISENPSLLVS